MIVSMINAVIYVLGKGRNKKSPTIKQQRTVNTMIENDDKKKKKKGLLVLLTVCIVALGLVYFLPSDEPITPETYLEEATQAQETIGKLKDKFDELGLDTLTSMNYVNALKTEGDGNSAFAAGDYMKALPFYNSAIDLYQEAFKEAESNVSENTPTQSVITEPEVESNVSENIPPQSVTTEPEAKPAPKPISPSPRSNVLELARQAMLRAKNAASGVDAANLAPNAWQTAERKEEDGNRRYNSGSKNEKSIKSNLKDYEDAKKYYEQAEIIARPKKEERDRKAVEEKGQADSTLTQKETPQ